VTGTRDPERTRVVVVGAGQAGLSAAWHLRRRGLEPGRDLVVLDRGPTAGGAWQHRWDALRLGRTHRVADLPGQAALGLSFDDADPTLPASRVVRDAYARYEEAAGLAVRRPVEVTGVTDRGRWLHVAVTGSSGPLLAEVLVNATGTWGAPFVPWLPGLDRFTGRQLHTAGWRDADDLAGLRVLVVGGGISAVEHVLALDGVAASVTWATRRPVRWTADERLGTARAVAAIADQDAAARAGRPLPSIVSGTGLPTTPARAAARARGLLVERPLPVEVGPESVVWPGGERSPVDAIVWATGFRAELGHLAPLRLREPGGGIRVEDGVVVRDPRVVLAGYGPQASTIGANRSGRRTADAVLARLG